MLIHTLNVRRLALDSTLNVVCDGNSITTNWPGSADAPPTIASLLLPKLPAGAVTKDLGIAGQTWDNMATTATDVDAAWIPGRTNILIAMETTNSVAIGNQTGAQAWASCKAYLNRVLSVHPWKIVLCGSLPRKIYVGGPVQWETYMREFDALARAGFRAAGAHVFCDFRTGDSPFNHDQDPYRFIEQPTIWWDDVHVSAVGKGYMVGMMLNALKRLPNN